MLYLIRWFGDLIHLATIITVLTIIVRRGSCLGFSGKCQILYALVYTTRYLDIFFTFISIYNSVMKGAFIITSYLTIVAIFIIFRSTYKSKNDTLRIEALLFICLLAGIFFNYDCTATEVLWTFSIYLEAVALVPQYAMHKHLDGRERTLSVWYACMMGLYRFLYILNWVFRYRMEGHYDLIAIFGGVVQIGLLLGFIFYLLCNQHSDLRKTRNKIRNIVDTLSKTEKGELFHTKSINPNINEIVKQDLTEQPVKSDDVYKDVYANSSNESEESEKTTSPEEYDKLVRDAEMQDKLRNILKPDMYAKVHTHSPL